MLRAALDKVSSDTVSANARVAELSAKLLEAGKAAQAEKLELQKAHARELDRAVSEAVNTSLDSAEQRLRLAEEELTRLHKASSEEAAKAADLYEAEKTRMLEELERRDRYIESADLKIQELERQAMKARQSAAGELLKRIAEQEESFRAAMAEEKTRREAREKAWGAELARSASAYEDRIDQLEDLIAAKEKLLTDGDKFYRQKQLELDAMFADYNQRVNKFNEELFAQKQELSEKEKSLNDYRLKLEKEYAARSAENEALKAELTRAIVAYKNRK